MFEGVKRRLREIFDAPGEINRRAAPKIAARLRKDATTKRGNIPSFGKMGDVPIRAEVRANSIDVKAPDWVLEKAREKGQIEDWKEIVAEEASGVFGGK